MLHFIVLFFTPIFCTVRDDSPNQSDYLNFADKDNYIDKSLLIENFIRSKHKDRVVIAPSGYGKTTNLQMLEAFFQDPTDADEFLIKDPQQTIAYGKFEGLKISKISVAKKHFGKYRVVYFKFGSLIRFDDFDGFIKIFRPMIQGLFCQNYRYLGTDSDSPLGVSLVEDCMSSKSKPETLKSCGAVLTQLLRLHSNKECVVLIDDFDAPYQYMTNNPTEKLNENVKKIEGFLGGFIQFLTKDNDCVGKSYVTGTKDVGERFKNHTDHFVHESIFMNNDLLKFYGFSHKDVDRLAEVYELDEKEKNKLQMSPKVQKVSFLNETIAVFNPRVVMQYLNESLAEKNKRKKTRKLYR